MVISERNLLRIPRGRSSEVASFFAQLDLLSSYLFKDLAKIKSDELGWQSKRGMNTIGMLLAHNAIVEAFWLALATGAKTVQEADEILSKALKVPMDLDGMPIPPDGRVAKGLKGWTLARYRKLHDRARKFAKARAARLTTADLDRELMLKRANGTYRLVNPRWILFHLLEHQAGHYGQMLTLRHMYKDRKKK